MLPRFDHDGSVGVRSPLLERVEDHDGLSAKHGRIFGIMRPVHQKLPFLGSFSRPIHWYLNCDVTFPGPKCWLNESVRIS